MTLTQLVASHSDQRDIVLVFGDKSLGSIDQSGRSTPAHKVFEHQSAAADVRESLTSSKQRDNMTALPKSSRV